MSFQLTEYSKESKAEISKARGIAYNLQGLNSLFRSLKEKKYSSLLRLLETLASKEKELGQAYRKMIELLDKLRELNDEWFRLSNKRLNAEGEAAFLRSLLSLTSSVLSIFQSWENSLCEIRCIIDNQCSINYLNEAFKVFTLSSLPKCLLTRLTSVNSLSNLSSSSDPSTGNNGSNGGSAVAVEGLKQISSSFKGVLDQSADVIRALYLQLLSGYSSLGWSYFKLGILNTRLKITELRQYLKDKEMKKVKEDSDQILKTIKKKRKESLDTLKRYNQLRKNIRSIQRYYGEVQTWLSQRGVEQRLQRKK